MSDDLVIAIIGKDTKGRLVVSGMFEFWDRYGLRPEFFALEIRKAGMVPCITTFAMQAYQANWSDDRILSMAREVWLTDPEHSLEGIAEANLGCAIF